MKHIIISVVWVVLIMIYFTCKYLIRRYDFYKPLENKTVIMAWTHKCIGIEDGDWGLGDIIKGTYAMYELSKRMKFELIVDISQHNVSNFLMPIKHKHTDFVEKNKNNIPYQNIVFEELDKYIRKELVDKDVMILFCSGFIEPFANNPNPTPIADDAKTFLKKILTPKPKFEKMIQEKMNQIPHRPYHILHYRLGDVYAFKCTTCVKGKIPEDKYPDLFRELLEHIKKHGKGSDVLLSDSGEFKQHVRETIGNKIFIYDHPITHVRYSQKLEETRNTLIEFFVMTRAESIHSYSVYRWVSGFALIANKVFDVSLTWNIDDGNV